MLSFAKSLTLAGLAFAAAACATPEAQAGEWRLVASRCPDLVEDRRDRRVVWSRADLREDARDVRRTVCPASAFVYAPSARHAPPPAWRHDAVVYFARDGRYVVRTRQGDTLNVRVVH